jgi:CRP-like cAMP-binding protein
VVAETACRVRRLSAERFARLEREHPSVAIQFHTFVVRLLAYRLAAANDEIRFIVMGAPNGPQLSAVRPDASRDAPRSRPVYNR